MLKTGRQVIVRVNDRGPLAEAASSMFHNAQPKFSASSAPAWPESKLKSCRDGLKL
jgi:hypothetical protein